MRQCVCVKLFMLFVLSILILCCFIPSGVVGGQIIPQVNDVCASFQRAIAAHLLRQTHKAMVYVSARHLLPPHAQTLVRFLPIMLWLYFS